MRQCITLLAAMLVTLAHPSSAQAQEDFRSADLDRPIKVEDANAIEYRAWELEVGSRGAAREGSQHLETVIELKAGLLRNAQIGIELEPVFERVSPGGTEGGLESASAHVFYALRRETVSGPALAVRLGASTPGTGVVGHEDPQFGLKGIASRSFGRLRAHANGGYVVAGDADGGDYWQAGLGGDYPWGLFSRALLADVYAEIPTTGERARIWTELGMRLQLSNSSVLDVGLATRLDEWDAGRPNVELVLGLARVFGLGIDVDAYPEPSIR